MVKYIKNIDAFTKNVIIVFAGTSLANFLNLLYQLLIAHKLSACEFAAFNSLLAIFMVVLSPLSTIQMAVAKYSAEFNSRNQRLELKILLSDLFRKTLFFSGFTLLIFWFASNYIVNILKIPSQASGYILAVLLALAWLMPVIMGGTQGLELFWWLTAASIVSGVIKLALTFIFILLGYSIAGALGAFLISSLIGLVIYYFPLRRFIRFKPITEDINPARGRPHSADQIIYSGRVNYRQIIIYLFPVAISNLCFMSLVSFDMVLVKYFFTPGDSGLYSLAQMVGKIFLFLPGAISIVMFPRTSGLTAKNLDTVSTLKRSLLYVLALCILASCFYNLFPHFVLRVLTGKVYPESLILGRLFSISMSLFTLLYIFITYFLSLKDFRFVKYLVLFTILQFLAIVLFHNSLIQVQAILCMNAISLFCIHFFLAGFNKGERSSQVPKKLDR